MAPEAAAHACCGAINRGAATIYKGKLFRVTLDAHVVALDMKTGTQVWKQQFADFNEGDTATSTPLIANGVLITGMARGDFITRGFLNGWIPEIALRPNVNGQRLGVCAARSPKGSPVCATDRKIEKENDVE